MSDLSTTYLGLRLRNPLVSAASPLARDLDTPKRLEEAGAAAIDQHRSRRYRPFSGTLGQFLI